MTMPEAEDRMRHLMVSELRPSHLAIAVCVADGLDRVQIGERLHITPSTVDTALKSIRAQLGVNRTVEIMPFGPTLTARLAEVEAQQQAAAAGDLMTTAEVAEGLRVDPKTVGRWCQTGRIKRVKTPGGHWRIPRSEFERMRNTT